MVKSRLRKFEVTLVSLDLCGARSDQEVAQDTVRKSLLEIAATMFS